MFQKYCASYEGFGSHKFITEDKNGPQLDNKSKEFPV